MARITLTIWPFLLNLAGVQIFDSCIVDSEDPGHKVASIFAKIASSVFSFGVYVILSACNVFPSSFKKPHVVLFSIYETLVAFFFLEFTTNCIWDPIGKLFTSNLSCKIVRFMDLMDFDHYCKHNANRLEMIFMPILSCLIAAIFLLAALHVTRAVNFSILTDDGPLEFYRHVVYRLTNRIYSELPKSIARNNCKCKARKRNRGKSKNDDYLY